MVTCVRVLLHESRVRRQCEPHTLHEVDHAVRVHRIPAVEEDDLVTFHDRAHAEEGRQVEHEVGAAVDQGDLARVEGPEDPVQGGHGGREGGPRDGPELRDRLDHGGLDDERDGILPAIRWRWRYKVGGRGEGWAKVSRDVSRRSKSYLTARTICRAEIGCAGSGTRMRSSCSSPSSSSPRSLSY